MRSLLLALALLAVFSEEARAEPSGAARYDDDIHIIVDALVGEQSIMNGFAKGFAETVTAKPGVMQMDKEHPGFQRALESKIITTAGSVVHAHYPEIRSQLEGIAREAFPPEDARIAAVYLLSTAGQRFITAWSNDAETRLYNYWERYVSSYGKEIPADVRSNDREFAVSSAFKDLYQANARMVWPVTQWSVKTIQPDLVDRIPIAMREILVTFGICPKAGCERK